MTDKKWKPLLSHLYEEEKLVVSKSLHHEDDRVNGIADELEWEPKKTAKGLRYLHRAGLIDQEEPSYRVIDVPDRYRSLGPYTITEKGFDVARDLETGSRRRGHNQFIGLLTFSIAISSVVMAIPENFMRYESTTTGLVSLQILVFLLIGYLLYQERLLRF